MSVGLLELTPKELKSAIDWRFLDAKTRVRELRKRGTRYAGVRGSSVFFRTFSSEYATNGVIYTQEIKLLDLKDALKMTDLLPSRRVLLAMSGDVAIRCTCPAYL